MDVFKKDPNRPDWGEVFWIFASPVIIIAIVLGVGWFLWRAAEKATELITHITRAL